MVDAGNPMRSRSLDRSPLAGRGRDAHFRDVLEALPVAVYATDAVGRITFFNRAAVALAGRTPELGKDEWCVTWRLYSPDGTPMPHDQCPMAIALKENREVRGVEILAERPDGARVPVMPFPTPLRDASGAVIGAVNLLVNLGDVKRAEEHIRRLNATLEERIAQRTRELEASVSELTESERRFRLLVQGVTDYAIFMIDTDGIITNWNTGAQRIKRYAAEEIIGHHFSRFYPAEEQRMGVPQRNLAAARTMGRYEAEGWRVRKDGSQFWANVIIDAIHDESGRLLGFAKITRDLTERRAIEEQLRHAQKMEAIGQLTGGIAHDFNNLLTAVIGNLDLLSEKPLTGEARRQAAAAMRAVKKAANLTHQLLAFARRQRLEPQPTDLNALISGMHDMLVRTLGGIVHVELALDEDAWPAQIDANQIENAILNLAINARDAMPKGGTLSVATKNVRIGPTNRVGNLEPGDYLLVEVTDTGTGMSEEVRAKAFDPFFTTKDFGKGSGLGLSQVYGVVRQSGGTVAIRSAVGAGTTVSLYLPRARAAARASVRADARSVAAWMARGESALVVDDDDDVREVIVAALDQFGYKTTAAASGGAALHVLGRSRFDVVVMDFAMPVMNGIEVSRIIRSHWPEMPILFVSGHAATPAFDDDSVRDGFLKKPFVSADIARQVRILLDRANLRRAGNVVELRSDAASR
jgi:PAS domain S-box-containing protein